MIEPYQYLAENKNMRVLLYDQDIQRNKSLHRYLEDANIQVTAAYCLKDFLSKFEKPSLKILLIEHSRIQHYNIDIEALLEQLGLTFTVIDYTETETTFDFSVHYLSSYYYFPFTTEKDKELIKREICIANRTSSYQCLFCQCEQRQSSHGTFYKKTKATNYKVIRKERWNKRRRDY